MIIQEESSVDTLLLSTIPCSGGALAPMPAGTPLLYSVELDYMGTLDVTHTTLLKPSANFISSCIAI